MHFLKGQLGELVYFVSPVAVFSLFLLLRCKLFQERGQKRDVLLLVGSVVMWNETCLKMLRLDAVILRILKSIRLTCMLA